MRKTYIKPSMTAVRLQQKHIICASPNGYDGQGIGVSSSSIDDEGAVWTKEDTGSGGVWDEVW